MINARLSIRIASDIIRAAERSMNRRARWRRGVPAQALADFDAGACETIASARADLASA